MQFLDQLCSISFFMIYTHLYLLQAYYTCLRSIDKKVLVHNHGEAFFSTCLWPCPLPSAICGKCFVLLLSAQVIYRGFYTAIHNEELYPTLARASGRASSRYADIFDALADELEWRKLVIFIDIHDQPALEMTSHIKSGFRSRCHTVDVDVKHVESSKMASFRQHLKDVMKENSETGRVSVMLSIF